MKHDNDRVARRGMNNSRDDDDDWARRVLEKLRTELWATNEATATA